MSSFSIKKPGELLPDLGLVGEPDPISRTVESDDIVVDAEKVIYEETVAAGKKRILAGFLLNCKQPCLTKIQHITNSGTKEITSGHTSPAEHNFKVKWFPFLPILEGETVKVVFTVLPWGTASDVKMLLQTTYGDA